VLAYLRELLRRAGYEVHTSSKLGDALLLMRVTRFDLLLLGPAMTASAATQQSFQAACAGVPIIELGGEFSTHDAGEAGAELLRKIDDRLSPKTA
jgi:DNA-binding response OmpR family regulator